MSEGRPISDISEPGAVVLARIATENGAARDDLGNVASAALLAACVSAGVIDKAVTAALNAFVGSAPTLKLTASIPTQATVGQAYIGTVTAIGGTPPYSFTRTGTLLTGQTFSATTGALGGVISADGAASGRITITDGLGATAFVDYAITAAASASGFVTLFYDDSTKPLSIRQGSATQNNGVSWGPFSQYAMERGVGNYTPFEWSDGYASNDPYTTQFWTRRDDQTLVLNPLAPTVYEAGYVGVVRDTAAGTTTLRVKRRSGTNAANLTISTGEGRVDGSILGATLNLKHALFGPPPYIITMTGLLEPTTVAEAWIAFLWTYQSDSGQSTLVPTERVDAFNGGHNELDGWEITGLSSALNKVFTNQLYTATSGSDASLKSNGGSYVDLGEARAGTEWDARLTVTTTGWTVEIKKSVVANWTTYRTSTHPSDGRFATAPTFWQADAKAGYRWADAPGWVKSIDGSTSDFSPRYKTLKVEAGTAVASSWTNRTIDPATIPAASVSWSVTTSAIDNSVADGTVFASLTANSGYTYEAKGCSGIGVVGNQIKKTGSIPAGAREVAVWMRRTSDNARFLVSVQAITVLDNAQWWDDAAKVSLNFESQQVRIGGLGGGATTGTWSDYVDGSGDPTATLKAMLPGFATTGVLVMQATGGASTFQGLYGYTSNGTAAVSGFAFWFLGSSLDVGFKDGAGVDKKTTIAGLGSASGSFKAGLSWASTGAKACGNAGTAVSSATAFLTTTASAPKLWNTGYADVPFTGTKQRLFLYDPDDIGGSAGALVSDAILQGKTT